MHGGILASGDIRGYKAYTEDTDSRDIALTLLALESHLARTGRICPKPWCWKRFCNLFKPGYEPPWLSSWWITSPQEKKDLFLKQVEYLAYQTNRFHEARQFLLGIDERQWLFDREVD